MENKDLEIQKIRNFIYNNLEKTIGTWRSNNLSLQSISQNYSSYYLMSFNFTTREIDMIICNSVKNKMNIKELQ